VRDGRLQAALAAAIYLLVSLWVMRAVLPAPATMLPYAGTLEQQGGYLNLDHSDQRFVVAGT